MEVLDELFNEGEEALMLLEMFDMVTEEAVDTFPIIQGGESRFIRQFVFDKISNRFTDSVTSYTFVWGSDIEDKSDIVKIYKSGTRRMQSAIRNTVALFAYSHKLKHGYQGEIIINWLKHCGEGYSNMLLILDSITAQAGLSDVKDVTFKLIVESGVVVSTNVPNRAVVDESPVPAPAESSKGLKVLSKMSWESVDYRDSTVVQAYMDNEYGKHVREALSVLVKFPTYDKWVSIGDGPGVVNEACRALGKECYSTDISEAMIKEGEKRGNVVHRVDAFEAIGLSDDPIFIMYNSLSIHGLLEYVALKHPDRKVVVVSNTDAFVGRAHYRRYTGTSRLYFRNVYMPPGIKMRRSGPRPCAYFDFWDPNNVYCVDNDRAYGVVLALQRMAIPVKVSCYDDRYRGGLEELHVVSDSDVYMYDLNIRPGHLMYFDMNTGKVGPPAEAIDFTAAPGCVVYTLGTLHPAKLIASDEMHNYYECVEGQVFTECYGQAIRTIQVVSDRSPCVGETILSFCRGRAKKKKKKHLRKRKKKKRK